MSTISPPQNPETNPRVKSVFDDIRATRGSDFINNLWYYLSFDPALIETTWRDVKSVMVKPSHFDPMTKELIYAAVSIANSCEYCIHSHTAAARSKGMTDEQYAEFFDSEKAAALKEKGEKKTATSPTKAKKSLRAKRAAKKRDQSVWAQTGLADVYLSLIHI